MKKVFDQIQTLKPLSKNDVKGKLDPENKNVFSALVDLRNKNIFPTLYLDYLEKIEPMQRKKLSQSFLDITIFANSNMPTENILPWFLNGHIPVTHFFGIKSMATLRLAIERLNTLEKNQDSIVERINKYQDKQSKKGSKTLSERSKKATEDYNQLDEDLRASQVSVENIIHLIESNLATGRKI